MTNLVKNKKPNAKKGLSNTLIPLIMIAYNGQIKRIKKNDQKS